MPDNSTHQHDTERTGIWYREDVYDALEALGYIDEPFLDAVVRGHVPPAGEVIAPGRMAVAPETPASPDEG